MKPLKQRKVGCRSFNGEECTIIGGPCIFMMPSEVSCNNKFAEGPLAFDEEIYSSINNIGEDKFAGLSIDDAVKLYYSETNDGITYTSEDDEYLKKFLLEYVEGIVK